MIKLLELWNRRLDMTHDQAVKHWLNVHGPLVTQVLGPRIIRYVTNVGMPLNIRGWSSEEAPPYDGVAEFWLDMDVQELQTMIKETASILQPDERSFIGTYRPMLVREVVQKERG